MALMVALSLPLGWLAMKRQQHERALREVAAAGGHVIYDHAPSGKWQSCLSLHRVLSRSSLGDGIIWHPYQVSFYPAEATDDTLRHLPYFRKAKVLVLRETHVTDAGLVHLAEFKELRILDLSQTRITDAGLAYLTSMTHLQSLNLEGTAVTAAGVERLRQSLDCSIYSGGNLTSGPQGITTLPGPPK